MNTPFGNAKYIRSERDAREFADYDPLPLFRLEIVLDEPIREAELLVQSPGFGAFYINGREVTEDLFISATSDYDKILWYNSYDVTALLRTGRNVLGAIAGNGFFNESFATAWDFDRAPWRDAPQILLCLRVNGRIAAVSDESWRVSTEHSHITFSHVRSGERVDMRKYDTSWLDAGYDDGDWQFARLRTRPVTATLRPVPCQPIREHERIAAREIRESGTGVYVVDFGTTISGYAEITLCEERGREIRFAYAEELDGSDLPKHNRMNSPKFYPTVPFQEDRLIASGGQDRFKPRFTYHGFRYLRIEGMTHAPTKEEICAIFVHQAIARRSSLSCGSDVINFIYRAGLRSTYSNLFWCLTDCPTREKMGWTNDAQASVEQTLINFDILPLYEKWFEDIKVGMFADGSLHGTIPAPDWEWGHRCGPVCDCILYEIPYRVYLYTGNSKMLSDGIPYFERYIEFLERRLSEDYEFILGDWMGGSALVSNVPKRFVAELYLLKAYDITALAHRASDTGVTEWEMRRRAWRQTLAKKYLDETGACSIPEQTVLAMLIEMRVGDSRETLAEQLVSAVARDGYQLRAGMVGVQYVYHALSEIGRADLAFRLLDETRPGYRSWMEKGESTLWERWDGEDVGSHNHHMYSNVMAWFFNSLLGITPCEEASGFETVELRPCFVREIGFIKGEEMTVRGRIEAEWRYENGGFTYVVTVPSGVRARYNGHDLLHGTNTFFIKEKKDENN